MGKGYEVLEDQAQDVVVRCLYKPEDKKCAELLQETAIDVINFYREWLGFYPYRILTILPGMDRPAGGYPAATSIVVIHGMGRMEEKPELHWRWITAHEIGHQFGALHTYNGDGDWCAYNHSPASAYEPGSGNIYTPHLGFAMTFSGFTLLQ